MFSKGDLTDFVKVKGKQVHFPIHLLKFFRTIFLGEDFHLTAYDTVFFLFADEQDLQPKNNLFGAAMVN